MTDGQFDLVVVANRLPVDRVEEDDGTIGWKRSPGGLVTALEPILQQSGGAWVGWDGGAGDAPEPFDESGVRLVPVPLTSMELELYYEGFCNDTLWPLYHDVISHPQFHRSWWDAYRRVNRRFAEAAVERAAPGALVWVNDYQLQLVPQMLREMRPDLRIGFFLHIPFPPKELFTQLPWRRQLLQGLLGADLIGFQRSGGASNFLHLIRSKLGYSISRGTVRVPDGRRAKVGAYPISIDSAQVRSLADSDEVQERAKRIREELGNPRHIVLGVDRLDYTKGIPNRLRAFGELVADGEIDPADTVFVQFATPSRERIESYRQLRDEIERLVGRINGQSGALGRQSISYQHNSLPRPELVAMYQAADVMMVTPLRDGMNLVAKEYVASRIADDGALVLSEFAGAADELRQAFMVNPYDIDGMKSTLLVALRSGERDLARRMRSMRRQVRERTVGVWARRFLDDMAEADQGADQEAE
jgi:trehalose 6-phosphate synthase